MPPWKFLMVSIICLGMNISQAAIIPGEETEVMLESAPGVTQKGVIAGEKLWLVNEEGARTPAADGQYTTTEGKTIIIENLRIKDGADTQTDIQTL